MEGAELIALLTSGGVSVSSVIAGVMAYGRLQQKVAGQEEKFEILRSDIARLDERVADLTDFLLREHRGESVDQIRRPAGQPDNPGSGR